MTTKLCKYCHQYFPSEEFRWGKRGDSPRYQYNECKGCLHKRHRKYNREPAYRIKRIIRDARANAKRRGLDFSIDAKDLLDIYENQGGKCALSGHEMTLGSSDDLELRRYAASPDRIDNERGYTNDNVWLVCQHANSMKSSTNLEDFIEWCRAVAVTHKR